jgi:putative intracellular protease/amidase
MSKGKVLVIGSNATRIETTDGRSGATGQYLNETVVPMLALIAAGYEVVLATPNGSKPHIDEASDSADHFGGNLAAYDNAKRFRAEDPSMNSGLTLRHVVEQGLDTYDAIFVPGGQGPVVDLMIDPDMGEIARHFHDKAKPSAYLCHGPMATVAAMPHAREFRSALIAGDQAKAREWAKGWQYAGYDMTVFSDTEEKVVEDYILHAKLYFNMIEALTAAGGKVHKTAVDFDPYVIVDRELITGQNPKSDQPVAAALIAALDRRLAA